MEIDPRRRFSRAAVFHDSWKAHVSTGQDAMQVLWPSFQAGWMFESVG